MRKVIFSLAVLNVSGILFGMMVPSDNLNNHENRIKVFREVSNNNETDKISPNIYSNNAIYQNDTDTVFQGTENHEENKIVDSTNIDKYVNLKINNRGQTPLHYACRDGNVEVVKYLIAKGADINEKDSDGRTPLHCACLEGSKEIVKLLLDEGADVNAKDDDGDTPLTNAFDTNEINKNEKIIEYLLNSRPDVEVKRGHLFRAIEWGNKNVVKVLVDKVGIEKTNVFGDTPLHYACLEGRKEIVELLIKAGAKVNATNKFLLDTPLHCACGNENENIVELLIKAGAKVNATNKSLDTPLHYACLKGRKEIVKLLLDEGADKEATDIDNKTPLHYACEKGHEDIVELLESRQHSDLESIVSEVGSGEEDNVSEIAANIALDHLENLDIPSQNQNEGADKEATDIDNKTPLHCACEKGHEDMVELLESRQHSDLESIVSEVGSGEEDNVSEIAANIALDHLENLDIPSQNQNMINSQEKKSVFSRPVIKVVLGGAAVIGGGVLTYYALNKMPAFSAGNAQINKEVVDYVARPAWDVFKEKAKTVLSVIASKKVLIPLAGGAGWWYWLSSSESDPEEA